MIITEHQFKTMIKKIIKECLEEIKFKKDPYDDDYDIRTDNEYRMDHISDADLNDLRELYYDMGGNYDAPKKEIARVLSHKKLKIN